MPTLYSEITDGSAAYAKFVYSVNSRSGNTFYIDYELYVATDNYMTRTCWYYLSLPGVSENPSYKHNATGYELVSSKRNHEVHTSDGYMEVSFGFGYTSSGSGNQECWGGGEEKLGDPMYTVYYYDRGSQKASYDVYKNASHSIVNLSLSYDGDGTSSSNFTITGDANGATGVSNTSITSTKTVITKHTHTGWSTDSSAVSATYGTSGSFKVTSDVYLYAVWRDDSSTTYLNNAIRDLSDLSWSTDSIYYTVTLNGNSTNVSISTTKVEASIITTHTFKGWASSPTSSTALSSSTLYTSSTTVYAIWETETTDNSTVSLPSPTKSDDVVGYTVTLNNNYGENSTSTVKAGMTTTYSFNGWSTSAVASSGNISESYKVTSSITLYATWKTNDPSYNSAILPTPTRSSDVTYHTVTLNGNGGTTTTASIKTSTVVSYSFNGWSTSSAASSGGISAGVYNPTSDITLYATWITNSPTYPSVILPTTGLSKSSNTVTYTTTLILNGGSHSDTSITSGYTTYYKFSHWSSTTNGSSVGTSISGTTYSNLYAIWIIDSTSYIDANLGTPTKSASYKVTLNASGGNVSPTFKNITGFYTFSGWYTTNSSSGTKISNPSSYRATSNNILYAIWSSSPTMTAISLPTPTRSVSYKVTFDPSGGSVSPTSKNVTGSYTFSGWSTASGDSSKMVSNSNYITTSNITLYAIWSSNPSLTGISIPTPSRNAVDGTFTITLDGNEGSLSDSITNPIVASSKTSFTFAGWSTESGNTSNIISNTSNYTTTSDRTIYAIWTPDTNTAGITLPTSGITRNNSIVTTYKITLNPIDGTVSQTTINTNKIRRYTFKGWSPTGSTNNMVSSSSYIPTANITLKAAYNTSDSVNPVDLPNASKIDHSFLGWSIVEDSTNYVTKRYTASNDVTLYANYLANYRASLWIWYNGKWNKCIVNLFTGDRFNSAI